MAEETVESLKRQLAEQDELIRELAEALREAMGLFLLGQGLTKSEAAGDHKSMRYYRSEASEILNRSRALIDAVLAKVPESVKQESSNEH